MRKHEHHTHEFGCPQKLQIILSWQRATWVTERQEYIVYRWRTSVYSLNEQTNAMNSQHNLRNYEAPWDCRTEVKNMMGAKCVSNDPVSIKCKWGRRNASVWVVKKGWDGQKATERHKLNYLAKKNRLVQWNVGSKHVMRMWDTVKEVLQCEKTGGLSQHTPGMSSPHANHNSLSPNVMEGRASLGMDGWSDRVKCIRKITDQWLCQQEKQKN